MIKGKFIGIVVLTITFVCISLLIIYFNRANIPNAPGYYSYKKNENTIDTTTTTSDVSRIPDGNNLVTNNGLETNLDIEEVNGSKLGINGEIITDTGGGTNVVANSASWVQISEDELGRIVERGPDPPGVIDSGYSATLDRSQYVYEKIPDYNAIFMVADQPGAKYYGTFESEDECASACQNDFKFCAAYAWNPEIGTHQCFGRDLRHASMMPHRGIRSGVRKHVVPLTKNDYLMWPNYNSTFELNPITNDNVKYYGKQTSSNDCLAQCRNDQEFARRFLGIQKMIVLEGMTSIQIWQFRMDILVVF